MVGFSSFKRLITVLFVYVATVLGGCGGGTESTMSIDNTRIAIYGLIKDDAGVPLQNSTVTLVNDPEAIDTTTTDADGAFTLEASKSTISDSSKIELLIENDIGLSNRLVINGVPANTGQVKVVAQTKRAVSEASIESVSFIPRSDITSGKPSDGGSPTPAATPGAPSYSNGGGGISTPQPSGTPASDGGHSSGTPTPVQTPPIEATPTPTPAPVPLAAPQVLAAEISLNGSSQWIPTVSWAASSSSSEIQGYKIYRQTSADSSFVAAGQVNASQLSFSDSRATDSTEHVYYRVVPFNADGEGIPSSTIAAMPQADFNSDGCVDNKDLTLFSQAQIQNPPNSVCDLNHDNRVDLGDLGFFAEWQGWCR